MDRDDGVLWQRTACQRIVHLNSKGYAMRQRQGVMLPAPAPQANCCPASTARLAHLVWELCCRRNRQQRGDNGKGCQQPAVIEVVQAPLVRGAPAASQAPRRRWTPLGGAVAGARRAGAGPSMAFGPLFQAPPAVAQHATAAEPTTRPTTRHGNTTKVGQPTAWRPGGLARGREVQSSWWSG